MSNFAFSSPWSLLYFPLLAFVMCLWIPLWNNSKHEKDASGRLKYPSFWRYWFWDVNMFSRFCNWYVAAVFVINIGRLICTIIYGFAPGE